jgi:GGDEF domain-containing protein
MPREIEPDPHGLDVDQTLADRDQTFSDTDQTASDSDQTASDMDELAALRDQRSAERDQESADRDQASRALPDPGYDVSRRGRSQSALDRDISAETRADAARIRLVQADQRDAVARWRDGAAEMRDRMATVQDEHDGRIDDDADPDQRGLQALRNAAADRERATANRARSAGQRKAAAEDREHAAEDRRMAALDRVAAETELAAHGLDHLTGALRRRTGLTAMQREIERTAGTGEPLVLAFVTVDGVKSLSESKQDELLRAVSECVRSRLGSYDLIARYGPGEFVVSMAGEPHDGVRACFELVAEELARTADGATITVGFAERSAEEALAALIERAAANC